MSSRGFGGGELGWPWSVHWPTSGNEAPSISFAPDRLWQPINPGWSFGNVTINSNNSSAPEVEQAVVSRFSYGKQIGRMMDALEVVVELTRKGAPKALSGDEKRALDQFTELAHEVAKAKDEAIHARIERLRSELDALKKSDPGAWKSLVGH